MKPTLQSFRGSSAGRLSVLLMALTLVLAACGGDDGDEDEVAAEATDADEPDAQETAEGEEEPTEEEPTEESGDEAAGDGELVWEDGVLQPLADGFPDRPITLVVVDDPGSRDALYAADMAAAVADMSPVEIVVSHEPHPQGGTLPTMSELMERDGAMEGYYPEVTTLVGTPTDFHIEPIEDDWGISLDDVQFLIATEELPYVLMQRADAPWGETFDDFVEYGRENPGELRYISGGVGSGHDIAVSWLLDGLGIEVDKVPAQDHPAAAAAVGAGEGDFTMTRASLSHQNEEAGRAKVVFVTSNGVPEPWSEEDGVKSRADYEEYGLDDIAWGIILGYMVPADVPDEHDRWLFELFKAGFETEGWPDRAEANPGLNLYDEPLTPDEAQQLAEDVYEFSEPITRDLGIHWEEN